MTPRGAPPDMLLRGEAARRAVRLYGLDGPLALSYVVWPPRRVLEAEEGSQVSEGRRVPDLSHRLDLGLNEVELLADIAHLSWRQRVIVVKVIAGFSADEIAVGLGCGRATVYREMKRLRPLFTGYQSS